MSWVSNALRNLASASMKAWTPQVTTVRFRYYEERMKKGFIRRYGYKDPIDMRGTLPRESNTRLPIPVYRPKDAWSEKKACFGQNDYIDILGNESLHPTRILYNVPMWLRGFKGKEYHMLLRKRKMWKHGVFPIARPTKWKDMEKRIRYLYRFLNRKTKTGMSNV